MAQRVYHSILRELKLFSQPFILMIKRGYPIRAIPVFIEKVQLGSFLTTLFLSID